ncbi:hypothetical protein AVEN_260161-1 [Araneus ventricosus]|uniref:Uncharacterized protein n=1 Tax=Araneus ventricosus TaxID=182803 RepID=A0A4Y2DP71_ARAVE|nr:hypothetical protein AVEN_260161-1 [Araneus ventricosus]
MTFGILSLTRDRYSAKIGTEGAGDAVPTTFRSATPRSSLALRSRTLLGPHHIGHSGSWLHPHLQSENMGESDICGQDLTWQFSILF